MVARKMVVTCVRGAVVLLSVGLVAFHAEDAAAEAESERLIAEAKAIEAEDLVDEIECLRDEARRGLDVAGELREVKDELERRKKRAGIQLQVEFQSPGSEDAAPRS